MNMATPKVVKPSKARFIILGVLFFFTVINYADRATISLAGPAMAKDLHMNPVAMGYIFSAFGWSYMLAQIPGGWLLDRYGSKMINLISLVSWSMFTLLQGYVGFFDGMTAIVVLFSLRFLVGLCEAPAFPGNARLLTAWFPAQERGMASATVLSSQYMATVLFAPLMGWITQYFGWKYVFIVMGVLGFYTCCYLD